MSLRLTVRNKTYQVDVSPKGVFSTSLSKDDGERYLTAESLKELEKKLTTATRTRAAKVAIKLKRLGRKPEKGYGRVYGYYQRDEDRPWEVITITVRGINEHTGHPMVTWPDGKKSDDEEVGRYHSDKLVYFPLEMDEKEILHQRHQIDTSEAWLKKHSVNVMDLAKKAVAQALGDESPE
jgi:hypothetical protein